MLTQPAPTPSNLLTGEQGMESSCRGWCFVVQDVCEGGLSSGRQRGRLPLLEEHAAGLQELSPNCALQLEGGLELFYLTRLSCYLPTCVTPVCRFVWGTCCTIDLLSPGLGLNCDFTCNTKRKTTFNMGF